ncbi:hypothetical protein U9M48_038716 [Paspalum notatum var. saurae]|uniref:Uncharacterized protein n=1 Tax=Paspalum notatum var. saurae TaxID=547442 RepID=A0AAQ3UI51_PASNO
MEDMLRACALTYGTNREAGLPFASFRTTMDAKPVWVWRHLKLYMEENVEPLDVVEVGERSLVGPALIKEARRKGGEVEQDRRKLNPDEELCGWREDGNLVLKRETRCTRRCHLFEGQRDSKSEENLHPATSDLTRFRNYRNRCVTYTTCFTYPNSKVPESTGPTSEPGCRRVTTGPSLSRETNQDFGHGHPEDTGYNYENLRVLWSRHGEEEATWEREDALGKEHPHLVRKPTKSRGRDFF